MLGSLDRGLAVLEFLARRGEARLAELAKEMGTSRTTMFRVLETLRARGFAEHDAASHTYRLGPGARLLAAQATRSLITQLAEPVMAELRNETGETINLVGVHGGRLVYEAVLEGGYALRNLPSLGQTVAAHCSALGKAVLALSPPAMCDVLLGPEPYERFNERTITSRRDLDLVSSRRPGSAGSRWTRRRTRPGSAAWPPRSAGRTAGLAWAISVSGLTDRMHQRGLDELGRLVQARCAGIGAALRTG